MLHFTSALHIIIYCLVILNLCWSEILVTLPSGSYLGEIITTYNKIPYNSFKGIQFATAERFKEGVEVADSKVRYNATDFGPACFQDLKFFGVDVPISEDCLYLNVYSPDLKGSLPVIVFIHGGDYVSGATNIYHPDFFMETGRVVVVTITYRLTAFGFLYLDDPKYPANLGLRDQIIALKWVQRNIKQFGGDPSRVTINGQSAGSASVNILMYSPKAKGLFVGAIGESGVTSGRWSLQPRCTGLQRRDMLAQKIGCDKYLPRSGSSSDELVKCLSSKTPDEIINAVKEFDIQFHPAPLPPTVEPKSDSSAVITFFPWLETRGPHELVPWITGVNSNEGLSIVASRINGYNNAFMRIGVDILAPFVLPDLMLYKYLAWSPFLVSEAIKYHYQRLLLTDIKRLGVQIITDGFFFYPLVRSLMAVHSPAYVYFFNYRQPHQTDGVGHSGELQYIWPNSTELLIVEENKEYSMISRNIVDAWITFAYNQTGKMSDESWERYNYKTDRVLIIDNDGIKMAPNPTKKRVYFWKQIEIDTSPKTKDC